VILFKLAWRELKRSWRFAIFFIFNLSLGLTGFVSLQAFNTSLKNELTDNARVILTADLAVYARRELTDQEKDLMHKQMPAGTSESQSHEFFAMLSSAKGSRLVFVKAIDDKYPFYGKVELHSAGIVRGGDKKDILSQPHVWMYPELQSQMGLQIGDDVQLGKLNLKISDIVDKDETQTFRAAAIAPCIFVSQALLPQSGLIQFGSTYTAIHYFKLPKGVNEDLLKDAVYKVLTDPQITVDTPKNSGEDSGRQLGYLSDYLGLVAIVALFMSALGAAYIYRLFLSSRMKEIAILRTLGLQSSEAVGVYVIQASMLGLIATVPTVVMSEIILPLLTKLLNTLTPFTLKPTVTLEAWLLCLLMAVLGSFIVSLPFLVRIYDLKAAKLFNEERFSVGEGRRRWWPFLPTLALFFFLAVFQSHSWKTGSIFIGALIAVVIALLVIGYGAVKFAGVLKNFKLWFLKFSFLSLSRRAGASLAVFVALGLGALLINILPQLKNSLQMQFRVDPGSKIPSLFAFDIQDEQIDGVKNILAEHHVQPLGVSPMIRARILKVNGQDYERKIEGQGFKTREEERDARFRNRGVNLSYREKLSDSEEVVAGKAFSDNYDANKDKIAKLSVEEKFAERMGFHLNDIVQFDVQGVEVEGRVENFRKVKWTTFQPNFFILVQNGVLNDAPKTYILAMPSMDLAARNELQSAIAKSFSNVSVIDVVRTVGEVLKTAEKMSWSLELMAYLALLTGYIVLFSIVRSQIKIRRWELNMLKILGANFRQVTGFILAEFAFLAFVSSFIGAFLSVGVSFALNKYIFDGDFEFSLAQPLISVAIITVLSVVVSILASIDVVRENALSVLREGS
jgi:putative ABC transport system permease protein